MNAPVTVAITRHLPAGHEAEMVTWLNAGIALAARFPGFLGGGWVRPEVDSVEWHMLYRFADPTALEQWELSSQRQWWRSSAAGLGVVEARVERRTGIEGWFDVPTSTLLETDHAGAPPASPPPRWKQATTIWLGFFPISLVAALVLGAVAPDLPVVWRTLVATLATTPVMVYVVLPRVTRALAWWLAGDPPPWRRTTSA